jgi:5-formaminoimidazole-4-carboxamide-1-beta-D-ribofuranosyl 5'-monophosphate synthetase
MVLFGPYNRYQLYNHNQMTVATLHSHSFNEYPTDGSKLYPHCTITTCERALHRKPTQDTMCTAVHTQRPKDILEQSITGHCQKRQHVFETD